LLTPQWVAKAVEGKLVRAQATAVQGFSVDSRTLNPRQFFVALKGKNRDGHDFLDQAFQQGATGALISDPQRAKANHHNLVVVDDTAQGLQQMARRYRLLFQTPLIGVTGSVGKTTTKELLGRLLQTRLKAYYSPGNFNNEVGLPLSLLNMPFGTDTGVFELATQRPGELKAISELLGPSVGIITTVTDAHVGHFADSKQLADEKWALIDALPLAGGIVVINADNPPLWNRSTQQRFRVDFGIRQPHVSYRAEAIELHDLEGMSFTLAHPLGRVRLRTKLLGTHNVYNILAAVAVAMEMRVEAEAVQQVVADLPPYPHRLECKPSRFGTIVDDCYNASPSAVHAALCAFSQFNTSQNKVFVFGDMLELGEHALDYHQQVAQWVQASNVTQVFTVGNLAAETAHTLQMQHGWPEKLAQATHSLDELKSHLNHSLKQQDNLILVKGSRLLALDQLVDQLA